jgi:hypothetical protein
MTAPTVVRLRRRVADAEARQPSTCPHCGVALPMAGWRELMKREHITADELLAEVRAMLAEVGDDD